MKLGDLIAEDRLAVPLGVDGLSEAAAALRARLVAAGVVRDEKQLIDRMAEEWPEDMVAMGDRAFLLHYRTDAVTDLQVALGTSPTPICRQISEEEAQCARIVLLIVAPPRLSARYLHVLGAFGRMLGKPEFLDGVLAQQSARSLAALLREAREDVPEQLTVRDIMTENPRTISPDSPLREAALSMVRAGVGGLPVVDAGRRVVGMLSEKELMRHLMTQYLLGSRPQSPAVSATRKVRDVMTRQVLCVSPDQPLAEVASLMTNKDVDRIPVVHDGRLTGFLTRGDIVRKLIGP